MAVTYQTARGRGRGLYIWAGAGRRQERLVHGSSRAIDQGMAAPFQSQVEFALPPSPDTLSAMT